MLDSFRHKKKCRLIEENLDYLVQFAFFRVNNKEEAEDIVYEAVTRFLEKDSLAVRAGSMRAYLFRIVYNLCQDYLRKGKYNPMHSSHVYPEFYEEDNSVNENPAHISEILECLPSRNADIIRMKIIDNLSFKEICAIMDIPESTAKSRFKTGIEKLRKIHFHKR